jgi:hypothetical protein
MCLWLWNVPCLERPYRLTISARTLPSLATHPSICLVARRCCAFLFFGFIPVLGRASGQPTALENRVCAVVEGACFSLVLSQPIPAVTVALTWDDHMPASLVDTGWTRNSYSYLRYGLCDDIRLDKHRFRVILRERRCFAALEDQTPVEVTSAES